MRMHVMEKYIFLNIKKKSCIKVFTSHRPTSCDGTIILQSNKLYIQVGARYDPLSHASSTGPKYSYS